MPKHLKKVVKSLLRKSNLVSGELRMVSDYSQLTHH
jgi:hypothetical protein